MPHVFDITARLQVDPVSLARANSALRGVGQGKNSTVSVNTAGAVAGLSKVNSSASAAQAALRATQAQAASLNATLNVTATVTNAGASNLANLATQAGLAARRFLAFSVAAGTMVRVVQGLKEGVRAAVDFELSMNKVAQVSTDSRTQIQELRQTISGLATSLGVSSAALAETSVTLKQAGFSIKQTRDALEALALVDLAPTFDGQKQAAEGLIAAFRQFDLSSRDFKSSLSSINAVAAEFAVESSDIVTAIQKAGGAFKVSAGDMKTGSQALNEFVALFTSVRDTTRESADSIATGLRTVFTRLQRQDTVAALKDLGINLRYTREEAGKLGQSNLENQFVGAYEAVRRLSEGLAGLRTTDPRYSQVVEQLGGYRQISRVIPLLQQFETAQKALNIAQAGQLSLQAAAEKRQETLAAKTAKLKEEYLDLFRKIVDSKGFQGVANGVLVAAGAFKTFLDAARPLLPLLTALAAIKIGANIGGIFSGFARSFVAPPGTASVKKYASGGFVPGSGNNDTEPALLMPGEFVLNKQAVAKMGVPALRDLNEGRRVGVKRYAKGSKFPVGGDPTKLVKLKPDQHATYDELYESARGYILKNGGFEAPENHRKLYVATSAFTTQAVARVPKGSGVVGIGSAAVALLTPFRDIIRLQSKAAVADALARRPGLSPQLYSTSRAKSGAVLQATAVASFNTGKRDEVFAERVPYAEPVDPSQARSTIVHLRNRARKDGYRFVDAHDENVGVVNGVPYVIDPGAVIVPEANAEYAPSSFSRSVLSAPLPDPRRYNSNEQYFRTRQTSGFVEPKKFAAGGVVPGSGNNDSEPALLMPGEFVLNKGAVARMGVPALRDLNEGRSRFHLKRYAKGSTEPVGGATPSSDAALPGLAEAAKEAAQALKSVGQLVTAAPPSPGATVASVGKSRLDRLRAQQKGAVDQTQVNDASMTDEDPFLKEAASRRAETSAAVREATSPAEAARVKASQQSEAAAQLTAGKSGAQSAVANIPPEQRERFFQLNEKAVNSANKYAEQSRGRAGETASVGGDLEDFVTEHFATNAFPKILAAEANPPKDEDGNPRRVNPAAYSNRAGVIAAQAYFTKQGKYTAAGVLDESQDMAGREVAPQDAVSSLAGSADPEAEEAKRSRTRAKQLAQVKEALGGKLPETHQEMVDAAKALGVSAKVAHTATGSGTDSAGNITNVLAGAIKSQIGATNTTDDINALKAGGVAANNPTALQEGRPTALAGGAGRPPRKPPIAPPTGGAPTPPEDPFDKYRKNNPDEAAYQDYVLAERDARQVAREVAKGKRFDRAMSQTKADEMGAVRAGRRQNYANTDPLAVPQEDRLAPGGATRERLEQEAYQRQQLLAAEAKFGNPKDVEGGTFGVPGDETVEQNRRLRAQAIGKKQAAEFEQKRRAESNDSIDPLLVARDTRRDRAFAQQQAKAEAEAQQTADQRAVADRLNYSGDERTQVGYTRESNGLVPATDIAVVNGQEVRTPGVRPVSEVVSRKTVQTTAGDRILARRARDIDGNTDPLAVKQAALTRLANGENPQDVLEGARNNLSPAQYAQVFTAAQAQGFAKPVATIVPNKGNAVDLFGQVGVTDPYTGEQQMGPDGTPAVRSYGLIAQRAKALADKRITARGGSDNLSDSTKAVVEAQALAEQELAVKRELISAQENLLKVLQPQMTAMERQTKAIEDTEKALRGEAKVVKDQTGKILGTEDAVKKATAKGVQAPGAGGFTYGLQQRFGGYLDRAREFASNNAATRFNQRLAGFTNSPTFGYTAAGLGAAGAYAANAFDNRAGSVDDAATTSSGESTYKGNKGASGAISFGLAGAAAGFAAGGPVGAAIGAVAGAGYGLYSALNDSEKDIRGAKIGNALTELGARLSSFATGLPDGATTGGIGALLDTYEQEASVRAKDGATSFFGTFNPGDYVQLRNKDLRKEVGPLLPNIGQGLTAQAARLGRDNPDAKKPDVDRLLASLLSQGQNGRLLGLVARLRGTSTNDEERQLREAVVQGQQKARVEQENRTGQNGVQSSVNSFDRLTKALQASADGLSSLQARAAALSDVFDGTITAARVSANSEALDQFGRGDNGALAPLDIVAAATGDLGGQLRASGGATNAVRGALDRVLPTVIANRGIEAGDVTTEVTRGLYRDLGYDDPQKAPQEIQRTVAAVAAQLNHAQDGGRGLGGILNEVQVDASKFSDTLVSAMSDPIKEFGSRAAKQLEENANKFIDGLTTLAQRTQQVGQLYDQRASLRGNNFRTQFQIQQERTGRGNEGLGRATVEQLEQGFDARQRRLGGNVAFSPTGIGRELGTVRTQIEEAVGRQQAAFASSGGNSPAFQQAAQEVVRLKDRAANLQQALKNLSDIAERSAVIQEKLNRLKQEEDGRLGLAERFATADYSERARINQGFALANQAANAGTLDGFGADQQRQIVEALRSAGGVTLTGFNGSPRADDLLKNLLGNSFGGAFRLTGDQQRERENLRGELGARGATAEQALGELIKHQEDANTKFFDNLRQQQTQFFATLSALLLKNRLGDVDNQIAGATARQRELQDGGGRARELLARVGVTTSDQLAALRGRQGDLVEYRDILAERGRRVSAIDSAATGLTGRSFGDVRYASRGQGLADYLSGQGFDQAAVGRVAERARTLAGEREFRFARTRVGEQFRNDPGQRDGAFADLNRQIIRRAIQQERYAGDGLVSDSNRRLTEVGGRLAGIQGVNVDAIDAVLSGPEKDQQDFLAALGKFNAANNRIEDFGDKLKTVTDELDKLRGEAERLRTQLNPAAPAPGTPGGAVQRANGGSIFQPRGTDTVPAMLTPGEFVINAASARANAGLLHHINTSRGPVQYRQDGGPIVRRPSPPTLTQVAQGYLWAQDKINKGLGWLGFANGGQVPTGFELPEPIARRLPDDLVRDIQRDTERERRRNPPPISEASYEARRSPTGRTAQARVEAAASAAVAARQVAAAARHERERQQYENDRAHLHGIDERRRQGIDTAPTVIGGTLSGAAQAGALTSAANGEDIVRRRAQRFHDREVARLQRNPNANAEEQRRAADIAAGNLAQAASVQTFARASFIANSRTRRPGDEGQRNIALRNVGLQQGDITKRFGEDPALQRYLALAGGRSPQQFATGGPVHGAGVGDTIPAMLTNGEFVLNQHATARLGKHNLQRFNSGGPVGHVSYLATGGAVTSGAVGGELKLSAESERAMTTLGSAFNQFVQQVGGFTNAAQALSQTFNVFAGHAQALSQAMSSFPRSLNGQFAHTVVVTHNGAEVFAKLTPYIEQVVAEKVNATLSRAFKEHLPEAGVAIQ